MNPVRSMTRAIRRTGYPPVGSKPNCRPILSTGFFSSGRGRVGAEGGRLRRSGSLTESRDGRSRAGRSREGKSREGRSREGRSRATSRRGSSAGGAGVGAGASSTFGGGAMVTPLGDPMAAVAGASTTYTGFDLWSLHIEAPKITTPSRMTCRIAETNVGPSGTRSRPSAGPMWNCIRRAPAGTAVAVSALPSRLGDHSEPLDARATDAVHRFHNRAVRERGVCLEVERLVVAVGERLAKGQFEPVRRHPLLVQEERLVLGDGEHHALFDGGRLRRGLWKGDVDSAVH